MATNDRQSSGIGALRSLLVTPRPAYGTEFYRVVAQRLLLGRHNGIGVVRRWSFLPLHRSEAVHAAALRFGGLSRHCQRMLLGSHPC